MPIIVDKRTTLFESLKEFYVDPVRLETLTFLLSRDSTSQPLSLRVLDYLVTNYAKKHNVVYYTVDSDGLQKNFNLYIEYKSQLKAYSKRWFDPFCRRERIDFPGTGGEVLVTTVGQLNFMRWAMTNGVVEYAREHLEAVENDMNDMAGMRASKKKNGEKRRELCKAAVKSCTTTAIQVTVRFS